MNEGPSGNRGSEEQKSKRWWYLLLLLPFIGLLYPPLYTFDEPRLVGVPFFYWYQFLWLFVSAAIVSAVYRATR